MGLSASAPVLLCPFQRPNKSAMPYKLVKASAVSDSEGTSSEDTKEVTPAKPRSKKHKTDDRKESGEPGGDESKDHKGDADKQGKDGQKGDLFLKNEWTQVVLKALHRMLQRVEAHCGVSTQLLQDGSESTSEDDTKAGMREEERAKELKTATLEGWKRLVATVPHLDTAANYTLGLYLQTQAPPDQDFVVQLSRLPPFEVVLLSFINNMHDNKAALLQYWTLPVTKKHNVLEDNLRTVLRRLVRPAMKTVKADGTPTAGEDDDEDDNPVRTVYLDEAHPLSGR